MDLLSHILPEFVLAVAAALLFVLGASKTVASRKLVPWIALLAMIVACAIAIFSKPAGITLDATHSVSYDALAVYVKSIATAVGLLFVLMAWPTSPAGDGNRSISFSTETGEYFALLLLATAGICVASSASSLPTLFLGFELASIPTYIMVTMSRPQEVAQEAGIKYFFLGAASSAVLLLGMAYLFGSTGEMQFDRILAVLSPQVSAGHVPVLVTLALVLMVVGLSFKLAAFPLHFYAGDVYQGAATPVTAAISFIPKLTAIVAIIKVLDVSGGGSWSFDPKFLRLLWIIAVLTMTVGNLLALWQTNVKRVLAYSSVAHSGYLLVGIACLASASQAIGRQQALASVLFYIAAYGIMNAAAFGVLMLLPSRTPAPATTAETYDDLAGAGRNYPLLGLAMTIGCLSLIGIPTTVGFFGKFYLLRPAMQSGDSALIWLAALTMINAAISTGYYLKIVAAMWLKPEADTYEAVAESSFPVQAAVLLSTVATLALGIVLPLTSTLFAQSATASASLLGH